MTSDARSSAKATRKLATGLVAGVPALLLPGAALAATTDGVVIAASVSGVTGAALGALVGGGVGYAMYRRNRRELQRVILDLSQANGARTSPTESTASVAVVAEPTNPMVELPTGAEAPIRAEPEAPVDATSGPSVTAGSVAPFRGESEVLRPSARPTAPDPSQPKPELIDALPAEPLRMVEAMAEPRRPEPPRPRIDLSGLPDPLAAPVAVPGTGVQPKDVEMAPGHAFVASFADTSTAYVPPASNPYLAAEPVPEGGERVRREPGKASDYEDVAVDYVARKSFRERMGLTARGVATVLGERMGRGMMDDLPVIERADGSVGDVGTTWWERDERVQRRPQAQPMSARDLASVSSNAVYASQLEGSASLAREAPVARDSNGVERSRLIVSRVATVEEEAYPEIGFQWNRREDTWESALAALDDRVEDNLMAGREERARRRAARRAAVAAQPQRLSVSAPPVELRAFADAVGAIDTLDEPDGLERDTQFLNFRAPGNHPEVQDTGSYINYLIEDEFKRNPSSEVRHQARSYLRVHEGGQNTRAQEAI